jgi:hypothetical protein
MMNDRKAEMHYNLTYTPFNWPLSILSSTLVILLVLHERFDLFTPLLSFVERVEKKERPYPL